MRVTDVTATNKALTDKTDVGAAKEPSQAVSETKALAQRQQLPGNKQASSNPADTNSLATSGYAPPDVLIAPPMHRWMEEVVVVHVYILTARNLQNVDTIGMSDPYLKLQVGQQVIVSDRVFDG